MAAGGDIPEAVYQLIREVRDIVIRLDTKMENLPERVTRVEEEQAEHRGALKLLKWAFPSMGAVVVVVVAIAVWSVRNPV